MRLRLLERDAGVGVDEMLGVVTHRAGLHVEDRQGPLAEVQGGRHRVADALEVAAAGLHLVDDELDEMDLVAVQGLGLGELADLAVDADLGIAAAAQLVEELAIMTLAATYERG